MQKRPVKGLVRASISFPTAIYQNLKEIAQEKKVSLAWVVREATERYVAREFNIESRLQKGVRGRRGGN
jgi:predicted transcriptional regulator